MIKAHLINSSQAQYTDAELSFVLSQLFTAGVFGDASTGTLSLAVSQNGGGDMSVNVALGKALVSLTKSGITWNVTVESDSQENVVIPANSSGSNRVDAIIVRVDKDANPNALKTNIATIERVAGTGTSALSDGAIASAIGSDGFIRLADITVANGATSITTGNITDTRTRVQASNASGLGAGVRNPDTPIGAVMPFAGVSAPAQFLLCIGQNVSRSTYANLFNVLCPSQTFTVTIASPAVITANSHGLVAGDRVHFATSGALPTGLSTATEYYVLSSGLTSNTFQVALTPTGTAINTSGTQSGTHTFYKSNFGMGDGATTFTIPDLRSRVVAGYGASGTTTELKFEPSAVTTGSDSITVPNANFPKQGQKIRLTTTNTLPTGLSINTDYYVIRVNDTTIKLATSQANANAVTPVPIDITGQGVGIHTIVYTNTQFNIMGERFGEENHGISVSELASHFHTVNRYSGASFSNSTAGGQNENTTDNTTSTGGDTPHNNMQPTQIMNYIIRY